jgi:hypothetical protein
MTRNCPASQATPVLALQFGRGSLCSGDSAVSTLHSGRDYVFYQSPNCTVVRCAIPDRDLRGKPRRRSERPPPCFQMLILPPKLTRHLRMYSCRRPSPRSPLWFIARIGAVLSKTGF